jgi:hypothetical protein
MNLLSAIVPRKARSLSHCESVSLWLQTVTAVWTELSAPVRPVRMRGLKLILRDRDFAHRSSHICKADCSDYASTSSFVRRLPHDPDKKYLTLYLMNL